MGFIIPLRFLSPNSRLARYVPYLNWTFPKSRFNRAQFRKLVRSHLLCFVQNSIWGCTIFKFEGEYLNCLANHVFKDKVGWSLNLKIFEEILFVLKRKLDGSLKPCSIRGNLNFNNRALSLVSSYPDGFTMFYNELCMIFCQIQWLYIAKCGEKIQAEKIFKFPPFLSFLTWKLVTYNTKKTN